MRFGRGKTTYDTVMVTRSNSTNCYRFVSNLVLSRMKYKIPSALILNLIVDVRLHISVRLDHCYYNRIIASLYTQFPYFVLRLLLLSLKFNFRILTCICLFLTVSDMLVFQNEMHLIIFLPWKRIWILVQNVVKSHWHTSDFENVRTYLVITILNFTWPNIFCVSFFRRYLPN